MIEDSLAELFITSRLEVLPVLLRILLMRLLKAPVRAVEKPDAFDEASCNDAISVSSVPERGRAGRWLRYQV